MPISRIETLRTDTDGVQSLLGPDFNFQHGKLNVKPAGAVNSRSLSNAPISISNRPCRNENFIEYFDLLEDERLGLQIGSPVGREPRGYQTKSRLSLSLVRKRCVASGVPS